MNRRSLRTQTEVRLINGTNLSNGQVRMVTFER